MHRLILIITASLLTTATAYVAQIGRTESKRKDQPHSQLRRQLSFPAHLVQRRSIGLAGQRSVKFQPPPPPDAPTRRPRGTASRGLCSGGSSAMAQEPTFTPIVPESNWGLTGSDVSTLWVAVAYPSGQAEDARSGVYELDVRPTDGSPTSKRVPVQLPPTSGTFRIDLPFSLQPNQAYRLYLVRKCDPQVSVVPEMILFESLIQRLDRPDINPALKPKTPAERIRFYAKQGVWFDAFHAAATLACDNPSNPQVRGYWQTLLRDDAVNLDDVTNTPLICQQASN